MILISGTREGEKGANNRIRETHVKSYRFSTKVAEAIFQILAKRRSRDCFYRDREYQSMLFVRIAHVHFLGPKAPLELLLLGAPTFWLNSRKSRFAKTFGYMDSQIAG
jgi:hypothetical protein